jgi:hypothetical protein
MRVHDLRGDDDFIGRNVEQCSVRGTDHDEIRDRPLILGQQDSDSLHDPQPRRRRGPQREMQLEQRVLVLDPGWRHHVRNSVHQFIAHAVAVRQRIDVRDRPAFLGRNGRRGPEVDRLGTHRGTSSRKGIAGH